MNAMFINLACSFLEKLHILTSSQSQGHPNAMSIDTDVLIIGAGPSGLGMAVQLVRNFGTRNFEIIEKTCDVGGTWFVNSYPGCGCDVSTFIDRPSAPLAC